MLMVSDLLRAARDPRTAESIAHRSPDRFAQTTKGVPVVVWNVVGHCNLSCPHCYAAASKTRAPGELTTDEGRRFLDELSRVGTRVVIFSGGEPLLREDLFELVAHAHGLGLAPQLSTNGVFIDDAVAKRLAETGIRYVGISIDGLATFNDRYRGLSGGFERASAGLAACKRAGLKTGLRITLSRANREELFPLLDHAATLRVDRFYVSHLLYSGRAFRMGDEDLTPAESRTLLHQLFDRANRGVDEGGPDIVTGGNDSDGPLLLLWIAERWGHDAARRIEALLRDRGGNSAGEKILDVDHLGRVHPDQFWRGVSLGNVREVPFEQILGHPLLGELRRRVELLHGRCGGCRFLPLCRGSHRERAYAQEKDIWASDPACVMQDDEIRARDFEEQSA